jgi:predicted DNA-binding ribbon-helix-helix protein
VAKSKTTPTRGTLIAGNLVVSGRRTSVRLEQEMWAALKEIAERERCTLNALASRVYRRKKRGQGFTSAIRVFLMLYYRDAENTAVRRRGGTGRKPFKP